MQPTPPRTKPTAGDRKLAAAGWKLAGTFFRRFNVAYLPRASAWRRLPSGYRPVNNGEGGNVAVWTRSEMLVLGPTAGAYKPATSTWRRVSPKGPGATEGAVIGWTGHQVLVWGGVCCAPANRGMAYNPATNTWRLLRAMPFARDRFAAVWTGRHVLVWGGDFGSTAYTNGAAFTRRRP